MSETQNDYPFAIFYYTIPGTSISNSIGAPDLVNGILGAQPSLASALFKDASSIGALKPLTGLAFEKNNQKTLICLASAGGTACSDSQDKSLFASFSSEKEDFFLKYCRF